MYTFEGLTTKYTADTIIKGNWQIVFNLSSGPSVEDPDTDTDPVTP
jgi:hypothetical protein